jgi:hypothetical protein
MKYTSEKDFEKIPTGGSVTITLGDQSQYVGGIVLDNNVDNRYIRLAEEGVDTTIKYAQIESIDVS